MSSIESSSTTLRPANVAGQGQHRARFTDTELAELVERSSTLKERLGPDMAAADAPTTQMDAQRDSRLDRWCERSAGADWETFEKRLAWDGLSLDDARSVVGSVRLTSSARLPTWTDTLQACLSETTAGVPVRSERFFKESEPLPFEHLIAHFVRVGRRMLATKGGKRWRRMTDRAMVCLERSLLRSLSTLSGQLLYSQFTIHRALSVFSVTGVDGDEKLTSTKVEDHPDSEYQAFVREMCGPELKTLFLEYSVFARLVATTIDAWVRNSAALLDRLHADWSELVSTFTDGAADTIVHISPGLSDPHCGGAATHIVELSDNSRIVYKPKDLGLCLAFQQLIGWCNKRGLSPKLQPIRLLPRAGYGWVEFIKKEACRSEADAKRFYWRSGALLCLVHKLNGSDFHHGNVIAYGEHPVLIDLEALMTPRLGQGPGSQPEKRVAPARITDSVLATSMLPTWARKKSPGGDDSFLNLGGFFGKELQNVRRPGWTGTNTDRMSPGYHKAESNGCLNLPELDGETLGATDYLSDIIVGFEDMYELLRSNREALAADEPLSAFANQPVRFLFRNTDIYYTLLRRLRHPQYLREGIDRDIELDVLARGFIGLPTRPAHWAVVAAEVADMNRLDIPVFRSLTTDRALRTAEGKDVGDCFEASGFEVTRHKLSTLDDQDLMLQRELIKASFYTTQVEGFHENGHRSESRGKGSQDVSVLTPEAAVDEAFRIVKKLQLNGIEKRDGSLTWLSVTPDPESGHLSIRGIGGDLHNGRCGLALFFASLESVASGGDVDLRALVSATLQPVIEELVSGGVRTHLGTHWQKIGGTAGVGSYVYGLTKIGTLLGDPEVMEAATLAASRITPDKIEADNDLDVVSGAAGAALALLALYRETGDAEASDRALQCGRHLLNRRAIEPNSGLRAWRTPANRFESGFAHGAAGIAHALLELYRHTKESEFLDAALEAFAFERTLFVSDAANWRPYPSWQQEGERSRNDLWSTWCRGATGIGLARAANIEFLTAEERLDVEAAVRTTKAHLSSGVDHVCCGDIGRLHFMMVAADAFGQPELADEALIAAERLLARSRRRGGYALTADRQELLKPGFLQGLSGIGQTLLQITHPERFPNVQLLK